MTYSKEQLANMGSEKVRNTPNLFSLFSQYVKEDICELYHDCKLPNNCFGCSFNTTFSRWRTFILNNSNSKKRKIMSNSKITYQLKDNKTRLFFDNEVLDKNSTDEQWNRFINYPSDPEKVKRRKEYFQKLPNSKSDEKPVKAKAASRGKAKANEVVKEVEEVKEVQEGQNEGNTENENK